MESFMEMFREKEGGKISMSRVLCFGATQCLLIWGSIIVANTDTIPVLPWEWVLLICGLYGLNKLPYVEFFKKVNKDV